MCLYVVCVCVKGVGGQAQALGSATSKSDCHHQKRHQHAVDMLSESSCNGARGGPPPVFYEAQGDALVQVVDVLADVALERIGRAVLLQPASQQQQVEQQATRNSDTIQTLNHETAACPSSSSPADSCHHNNQTATCQSCARHQCSTYTAVLMACMMCSKAQRGCAAAWLNQLHTVYSSPVSSHLSLVCSLTPNSWSMTGCPASPC